MPKLEKKIPEPETFTTPKKSEDFHCFKVKSAFTHKAILTPGVINSETSLSQQKLPGAKMTLTPLGLFINYKEHVTVVPLANIANVVLEETSWA